MPSAPRRASISASSPVAWSDGAKFNGFLLLGLALPTASGYTYAKTFLGQTGKQLRIPLWTKIPIDTGEYDNAAKVFYNADLDPPNTRYAAWWYDHNGRQVAGPSALFEITSEEHTLATPTLTVPTATVSFPVPESELPADPLAFASFVYGEVPAGTISGTDGTDGNAVFTLTYAPNPAGSLVLVKNGAVLTKDADYTVSGTTITYISGSIPITGDFHIAAMYRRTV